MSNKREWFVDFVVYESPKRILVGNSQIILAHGRGNIEVNSFDGNKWVKGTIYDVLYVPNVCRNLFSLSAAMKKGCLLEANENKVQLLKNGSTIAVGENHNGLFYMKFKIVKRLKLRAQHESKRNVIKPADYAIIEMSNEIDDDSSKVAKPSEVVQQSANDIAGGSGVLNNQQNVFVNDGAADSREENVQSQKSKKIETRRPTLCDVS